MGSSGGRLLGSGLSAGHEGDIGQRATRGRYQAQKGIQEANSRTYTHSPESSAPSSHRHSHFPRSRGIPHSASTIMGNGVSLAMSSRNSGRAYRRGFVGISRNFGGHGGAGSGLEYRTRIRRSNLLQMCQFQRETKEVEGRTFS